MKNLNRVISSESDVLILSLLNSLGPLPSIVRYYDDFDGKVRTIDNFDSKDVFDVYIAGSVVNLNFIRLGSSFGCLAKHLFFLLITEDLRLSTAYGYISALNNVETDLIAKMLDAGPQRIKQVWPLLFAAKLDFMSMRAIK